MVKILLLLPEPSVMEVSTLQRSEVFANSNEARSASLQNMATNEIQKSLLDARQLGQRKLRSSFKE